MDKSTAYALSHYLALILTIILSPVVFIMPCFIKFYDTLIKFSEKMLSYDYLLMGLIIVPMFMLGYTLFYLEFSHAPIMEKDVMLLRGWWFFALFISLIIVRSLIRDPKEVGE